MHDPEHIFRRLIEEGFNAGDLSVADAVTSPDLAEHQEFGPDHAPGAEGVRAVISSLRRAFSDFHRVIDGRMVEHWGVPDRLSVLYQLGIVPRPVPRAA